MPERYQTFQNDPEVRAPDHWKKFQVILTGKTNGAHKFIVKHFTSLGQTEVDSPEGSDYSLVFCPVVSRVGTDISYALDRLQPGKEVVLVVMHHTFNPQQVIPPSSRLVEDERVRLTLDCLFHEKKLLKCKFNNTMKTTIKMMFRVSERAPDEENCFLKFFKQFFCCHCPCSSKDQQMIEEMHNDDDSYQRATSDETRKDHNALPGSAEIQ